MSWANGVDIEEVTDSMVGGFGWGGKSSPIVEGALFCHGDDGPEKGGWGFGSQGNEADAARSLWEGHQCFRPFLSPLSTRVVWLARWGQDLVHSFDDGRVEGFEVGEWNDAGMVVKHLVGADGEDFCGQKGFFGGKSENVSDACGGLVTDLVEAIRHEFWGADGAACDGDAWLDDKLDPVGAQG